MDLRLSQYVLGVISNDGIRSTSITSHIKQISESRTGLDWSRRCPDSSVGPLRHFPKTTTSGSWSERCSAEGITRHGRWIVRIRVKHLDTLETFVQRWG